MSKIKMYLNRFFVSFNKWFYYFAPLIYGFACLKDVYELIAAKSKEEMAINAVFALFFAYCFIKVEVVNFIEKYCGDDQ